MSAELRRKVASARVVLAAPQASSRRYLEEVLHFMGLETLIADSADALAGLLQAAGRPSMPVILSNAWERQDLEAMLGVIDRTEPRPALIQLLEEGGDALPSEQLLDTLSLPLRFGGLSALLHKARVYAEAQQKKTGDHRPPGLFRSLSGNSRAVYRLNRRIEQVAAADAAILLLGEPGTGKEVVARKLHYRSQRRGRPFVVMECGIIDPQRQEAVLFGPAGDGPADAGSPAEGLLQAAEGGTLFVNGIGAMPLPVQESLLQVLRGGVYRPPGSDREHRCDVRIIAACREDLEGLVAQGGFREDLYCRLNVFPINLPPLRDRADDVPVLVADLIARIEHEKRGSVRLTPGAVTALSAYPWPGNLRELADLIEQLAEQYPYEVVDHPDLPQGYQSGGLRLEHSLPQVSVPDEEPGTLTTAPRLPPQGIDLKAYLADIEQGLIRQALDEAGGVVAQAAKRLGVQRTTLVEKLRKYGQKRSSDKNR